MNTNIIAVYTNNISKNIDIIFKLKTFFNDIKKYSDFMIFSDIVHEVNFNNLAIIQSYHMRFFQGSVIFLNIDDYLANKDSLCKKWIVLSEEDNIDAELLYDCQIITLTDDQITLGALI